MARGHPDTAVNEHAHGIVAVVGRVAGRPLESPPVRTDVGRAMKFRDYYATLGVARDASAEDIKRAYRRLARQHHPDVSREPGAEDRFKEIGEAYEVLKDPEKRAVYDQAGRRWGDPASETPPPDWNADFEFGDAEFGALHGEFSEFFRQLFGRPPRGPRGPRATHRAGTDHRARVRIDLEDAFHGATRTIVLQAPVHGPDGAIRLHERRLEVQIPRGVRPGQQLRLPGQGGRGPGEVPAGDLYLEIEFRPHALYEVHGRDLSFELPVAPWEAALGATVSAPTPAGAVELRVPAGARPGTRLRLRGRGLPGDPPGDLYAEIALTVPAADTAARRSAWHALAEAHAGFDPRATLRSDTASA